MRKQILFILPLLFLIGMISAATTLISPAVSTYSSGTISMLNCSTALPAALNVSFYRSASTGGASTTLITNVVNDTAGDTIFNTTWDTTAVTDAQLYNFTCKAFNATASETSAGVVAYINNGVPTASWGTGSIADASNVLNMDDLTFATLADSTIGVKNCTFTLNSATKQMDATSNACSGTVNLRSTFEVLTAGTYSYNFYVTDYNGNSTTSANRTLGVLITPGGGGIPTVGIPSTTGPGIIQQTAYGEGGTGGGNWFTNFIDSIVNFFKNLF